MRTLTMASTVLSLLLVSAPARAGGNSHFGVRAGVNVASFAGSFQELVGSDLLAAPNAGLVYEYDFAPGVALHGELAYAGKGASAKVEGTDPFGNPTGVFDASWKFQYVEIPLLMRGRLPAVNKLTPFLEAGPAFSIRASGKIAAAPPASGELSLTDAMKSIDVGVAVGTGVEFAAGPGRLGVEARWTRGLDGLFKGPNLYEAINQTWTFALSYTR